MKNLPCNEIKEGMGVEYNLVQYEFARCQGNAMITQIARATCDGHSQRLSGYML